MHKLNAGAVGLDGQVDSVMYGRYVSVDARLGFGTIIGHGVDINLLCLVVPVGLGMKHTHSSTLKLEFIDIQVCICLEFIEKRPGACLTCGLAAELYAMEVYKIQNISHLYVAQVYGQRVGLILRC